MFFTNSAGLPPVVVIARIPASQTLANNSATEIPFTTELIDTNNAWNTGSLIFTAPRSAYYFVSFNVSLAGSGWSGTERIDLRINKNGVVYDNIYTQPSSASDLNGVHLSALVSLNAGEILAFLAYQNSGGTLNYASAEDSNLSIFSIN